MATLRQNVLTQDALMDTNSAAALLLVSRRTVQNWTRDGVIPSIKLGRRRMFLRSALQAHLQTLSDASMRPPVAPADVGPIVDEPTRWT
jgi:excisionase family DNA binding protein